MSKKNVLVIDDDAEIAMIIEEILESNDYRVIVACDGLRGIEKTHQENIDLILMDIRLPFFSGFWFCDAFKHKPETKNIPIVMVSSLSSPEDVKKAYQVGASGYLKKPFQSDELLEAVRSAIQNGK